MATLALETLAERLSARARARPALRPGTPEAGDAGGAGIVLAGVVAAGVLLGVVAAAPQPSGVPSPGPLAFRFAVFAAATSVVLWSWLRGRLGAVAAPLLLAALTLADLWVVARPFFRTVESPEVMFAPDDVASFLTTQQSASRDRVWVLPVPPEGVYRGQVNNYLMRFGVDQAAGEHGNQLQRWNQMLGAGKESYVDYHNFFERPAFLRATNIRWVVAGVELNGLREAHRGSAIVYENPAALPRAYLVPEAVSAPGDAALQRMEQPDWEPAQRAFVDGNVALPQGPLSGRAQIAEYDPDRVVVRTTANRPALLVLADNYYQDWKVAVDGQDAPLLRTNHSLRGVVVPGGSHTVTFTFEPRDLYLGWYLFLGSMGLLLAYGGFLLVRALRPGRAAVPA